MTTPSNEIKLQTTCEAIGNYYELMGKSHLYYPLGRSNKGKFFLWFEEQDMDLNDLADEFSDFEECVYLDFDDEFPFPNSITQHKEEMQFEIMRYCFTHARSPSLSEIDHIYFKHENAQHNLTIVPIEIKTTDIHIQSTEFDTDIDEYSSSPVVPKPAFLYPDQSLLEVESTTHRSPQHNMSLSFSSSFNRKPRQPYNRSIRNPLRMDPEADTLYIQKSRSMAETDVDLHYTPDIYVDAAHFHYKTCKGNVVSKCEAIQVVRYWLKVYSDWLTNMAKPNMKRRHNKQRKSIRQVFAENRREIGDLLRCFYHIIYDHCDAFDGIYREVVGEKEECDALKCVMMRRNYRDKCKMSVDIHRSKLYYQFVSPQEVVMQQILDNIHCHLYHAYHMGLRINQNEFERNKLNHSLQNTKRILSNYGHKSLISRLNYNKYTLHMQQLHPQKSNASNKHLKPKYADLKEEILSQVSRYQWKDLYYKAKVYIQALVRVRGTNAALLTLQHVLSCIIYCNFDVIQQQLRTQYNSYGHLNGLIRETIERSTAVLPDTSLIYVCLPRDHIIAASSYVKGFNVCNVMSCTSNKVAALTFSGANDGDTLLLELRRTQSVQMAAEMRAFDCTFISDCGAEYEILCNGWPMRWSITNLIDIKLGNEYSMFIQLLQVTDNVRRAVIKMNGDKNYINDDDDIDDTGLLLDYYDDDLNRVLPPYIVETIHAMGLESDLVDLLLNILILPHCFADFSREEYELQSEDVNCDSFTKCLCTLRVIHILKIYQTILNSNYWLKVPILPFVTFSEYSHQQIVYDFGHILQYHQNELHNRITVFDFVENRVCKCANANVNEHKICLSFERHCRNKGERDPRDIQHESYLHCLYNGDEDAVFNELDIESELDRIHVFFLHSLCKYHNASDIDSEYGDRLVMILQNQRQRIFNRGRSVIDDYENDYSYGFEDDDDSNSDHEYLIQMNENNVEPLRKFYFQSRPEFEGNCLNHICAHFDNIKEEVLCNCMERLSIQDWNEVLRKSRKQTKDWNKKKRRVGYNEVADVKQILSVKLYTDYDKLQHELKKAFRIVHDKLHNRRRNGRRTTRRIVDEMDSLHLILSNFYHWRELMISTITGFSDSIRFDALYHGVNPAMVVSSANVLNTFWGPLSTTTNKHVASTFATKNGMVLQLSSRYPRRDYCYQFDASIISDYPEENERIVGFMYARIRCVYCNINLQLNLDSATDCNIHNLNWYYFTCKLFTQGIYSMSRQIEPLFIEVLKESLEFGRKYKIESVKQFLKYKEKMKMKIRNGSMRILVSVLTKYRLKQRSVYIDNVSNGLKEYFLTPWDQNQNENEKDVAIDRVSYTKIMRIFPNLECISLYNEYRFDEHTLKYTIQYLKLKRNQLKTIKFIYFDYKRLDRYVAFSTDARDGGDDDDTESDSHLSMQHELHQCGWCMQQKYLKNGTGYLIKLTALAARDMT